MDLETIMKINIVELKGMTWNHSRGLLPMQATSQRFSELNPQVQITWEKRSLQEFADQPIDDLAKKYDFLVIDHPWAGFAAAHKIVFPYNDWISSDFLEDQRKNSVGHSYESYVYEEKLWALPIDAATPVASYRPDLLNSSSIPNNWSDLLGLAKLGKVLIPGIPQDTLMNFYMICCTLGEDVFESQNHVISQDIGVEALQMLRRLSQEINPRFYEMNPIQVYEAMTLTDEFSYCPFAYGYSNYARKGYARKELVFEDMIEIGSNGMKCRTTLGGTGLAVSSHTQHPKLAMEYAKYVASSCCQKTVFYDNGGQPGHREAWNDDRINYQCNNFFKKTLPALDRAYLRPRYRGHMYFQDRAGALIVDYIKNGGDEISLFNSLNKIYFTSFQQGQMSR